MDIDGIIYCSKCLQRIDAEEVCPHCGYDPESDVSGRAVLDKGTLLNGRYQLGAVIGRGGFGITYAAWDETLGMPVAVKEYFPGEFVTRDTDESDDVIPLEKYKKEYAVGLSRFVRESQVLAMLHEIPGVVKVLDCFGENETYYIAMEYIRGVPLDEYVKTKRPGAQAVIALMRQSVEALMAAHRQGVLHRDICPNNIMVQEDGSLKLIDFGAAAQVRRQQEGKDRSIMLTEKYAAIEQYDSEMSQGPWTDIYCLSATMYTVLTGENPPESVRRVSADEIVPIERQGLRLKKHQCRAIMGGLAVQPDKRIRSMEEFRALLYDLPMPEEVRRRKRFMRRVYTAAAIFLLIAIVVIVNFTVGLPLGRGLIYSLYPDGFHVQGRTGRYEEVDVPQSRAGIPVTQLADDLFTGDIDIRSVSIPGTIADIGDMAFYGCTNLESVYLNEGTRTIGSYAFGECPSLHTVYAPDSIEEVADAAFDFEKDCIDQLTIWSSPDAPIQRYAMSHRIPYAYEGCFEYTVSEGEVSITGCSSLAARIFVPSYINGMPVTSFSGENIRGIFHEDLEEIILPVTLKVLPEGLLSGREYLTSVELGNSLEIVGDHALEGTGITSIVLPDTVREIGKNAFYASDLVDVEMYYGVEAIGQKAFAMTGITEFTVPSSVKRMGPSVFFNCQQLKTVEFCGNKTSIPNGTFENCTSLETVQLTGDITGVGRLAFSRCVNLKQIVLPDSVMEIGEQAFKNCNGLELIKIPDGIDNIADNAFEGCSRKLVVVSCGGSAAAEMAEEMGFIFEDTGVTLSDVTISWDGELSVSYMGNTADGGVSGQADTVYLPSLIYSDLFHRTDIATSIILGNNIRARRVVIPYSVRSIGVTAFCGTLGLEEVVAERIVNFGDGAFIGCHDLVSVQMTDGLEEIGNFAFSDCPELTDVVLPDTVNFIGESAFMYCRGIEEINIPAALSSLPNGAFGFSGLREVTVPGNVTSCGAAFYNCTELERAELEEGVLVITGAFYGCSSLTEVSLPGSLQGISCSTFAGCFALKDVWVYSMDAEFGYADPIIVNMIYFDKNGEIVITEQQIEGIGSDRPVFKDCPGVTIHGYEGSTAEEYARKHGLAFEPITDKGLEGKFDSIIDKYGN